MKTDPVQKILAAMLASGVSVKALAAAKAKADAANGGASNPTFSTRAVER